MGYKASCGAVTGIGFETGETWHNFGNTEGESIQQQGPVAVTGNLVGWTIENIDTTTEFQGIHHLQPRLAGCSVRPPPEE
jgi:hypothetical protein